MDYKLTIHVNRDRVAFLGDDTTGYSIRSLLGKGFYRMTRITNSGIIIELIKGAESRNYLGQVICPIRLYISNYKEPITAFAYSEVIVKLLQNHSIDGRCIRGRYLINACEGIISFVWKNESEDGQEILREARDSWKFEKTPKTDKFVIGHQYLVKDGEKFIYLGKFRVLTEKNKLEYRKLIVQCSYLEKRCRTVKGLISYLYRNIDLGPSSPILAAGLLRYNKYFEISYSQKYDNSKDTMISIVRLSFYDKSFKVPMVDLGPYFKKEKWTIEETMEDFFINRLNPKTENFIVYKSLKKIRLCKTLIKKIITNSSDPCMMTLKNAIFPGWSTEKVENLLKTKRKKSI